MRAKLAKSFRRLAEKIVEGKGGTNERILLENKLRRKRQIVRDKDGNPVVEQVGNDLLHTFTTYKTREISVGQLSNDPKTVRAVYRRLKASYHKIRNEHA